jgi:hypothetical protein
LRDQRNGERREKQGDADRRSGVLCDSQWTIQTAASGCEVGGSYSTSRHRCARTIPILPVPSRESLWRLQGRVGRMIVVIPKIPATARRSQRRPVDIMSISGRTGGGWPRLGLG